MTKLRMLTLIGLAVLMGRPATTLAQEREPQREQVREQEVQEAVRRVQEAQFELQRALEQLRQTEIEEANRAMRDAMSALRLAQRELRADELRGILETVRVFPRPETNVVLGLALGRPRMGVLLGSDEWNAETDPIGAVLQAVTPGGPAEEAGLKAGDIVTKADGQSLARTTRREDSPGDKLVAAIRAHEEGDTLRVEYRRGEETRTANIELRQLESGAYSVRGFAEPFEVFEGTELAFAEPLEWAVRTPVVEALLPYRWLNIELVTLDEELGSYFGTSEGLLVVRAPRDAALDLRSGDVILSIDGREPADPRHALRIMRSYEPGETMNVEIMRNKRRQTVTVTVPERDGGFLWRSEVVPEPDGW
ncbi:MAG: PDZ domain-containing protein [Gemmatimonadota bacterium]|nr:MAG: PDZ domain-containing protein [Gemmatimonadota bacterium]